MIKLYLTDGVQEISGIEYKPMRNISCDITPGCKVVIKGPIECRRGVILLQESSVELLGGEVEDMVLSNCLAGVLASKLDLPIPQPQDPTTSILPSINLNSQQNTGPTRESNSEPYNKPVAVVKSVQVSNIIEDDIDFEQLEEIEARFFDKNATINQSVTSNKRESNKTNERVSNSILNYFGNTKNEEAIDNQSGNSSRRNSYQNAGMRYDSDIFDNDIDVQPEKKRKVESFFEFEDEDLREIEKIEMPVLIREPFTYVKEIQELDLTVSFGKVFKVKAQILKLLSKLSVSKEGWSLRCTIVDGTACLDVDFTSDVLSDLVGITPVEMNDIKRQMGTKPELKERAVQALQKAKDNLQVLYCIIEITIMEVPKITKLIPYEEKHVRLLQKRVERSGCFYV